MAEKLSLLESLGFPAKWYREGRVEFVAPVFPTTNVGEPAAPTRSPVFYNPFSALSRDLTVILARTFGEGAVAAEPLAGSGVRAIRLLVETNTVTRVLMNDINPNAVKVMRLNAEWNGVAGRCEIFEGDAAVFLTRLSGWQERVHYVDVDPVGAPVKFVENSLRAVANGGYIGVSATDLAPLVGNHPETCFRKYGLYSGKTFFAKEAALRLLASFVIIRGAALNIAATPVLSVQHRHFVRVFFHVLRGRSRVIKLLEKMGWIKACNCLYSEISQLHDFPSRVCPRCGGKASVVGPAWLGPLHSEEHVEKMLAQSMDLPKAQKVLERISGEVDVVGYYPVDRIAHVTGSTPRSPIVLVASLRSMGYRASLTHVDPTAVKTDAPLEDVLRAAAGRASDA
ncbi:MAG: tRNA (guanine(26)-N(2))-dimethyltransferase [Candidatus Caldarchaeum sp.]